MGDQVIQVKNFSKSYGDLLAVDDISFEVRRGEIFGILGPNGAGKTSTLESMEGLRFPNKGLLQVLGLDPVSQFNKLYNLIGVQLQISGLPENISPYEAMKFFCAYHGVVPYYDLLVRFGLKEKINTQYYQLSSGQQRRLGLALAVAHNPQIIFLDEPTSGLDVASRVELHNLILEQQASGTTIILATHDMAEAEKLTNNLIILLKGKIVAKGTPLELTATGASFTKISVRTQNSNLSDYKIDFPGVVKSFSKDEYAVFYSNSICPTVSAIITYIENNKDILIDLRVERPSLEERFLEITNT